MYKYHGIFRDTWYINKAGDSATGDPSSSTSYGGICMPACSQMVLDRWLLLFGCFFLFVCTFFVCFFYSICMCLLVVLVFVFLVFLWWWNLHASVLANGPGQVALDIYLVVSFSCVCLWMFFFLCLFLCSCVGLCWLACVFLLVESERPLAGRWFWSDCVSWLPWGDLYSWPNGQWLFKFRIWTIYLSSSLILLEITRDN